MGRSEKIVLKKNFNCSKNSLDFTVVIWWKWEDEEKNKSENMVEKKQHTTNLKT